MKYFSLFPKIRYRLDSSSSTNTIITRNIFFRFKIIDALRNNVLVYYDYYVKDNETPEDIAFKYYKDVEKHWLVMLANDVIDGQFDWPLSYDTFQKFLSAKYSSPQQAMLQTHHYEMMLSRTDSVSGITTTSTFDIDQETYNNNNLVDVSQHLGVDFVLGQSLAGQQFVEAGSSQNPTQTFNLVDGSSVFVTTNAVKVSCYDFENNLNEQKRQIKLIAKNYLDQIQAEFITLASNA